MLKYGPLPPRKPWNGRRPVAFIDTNVMHEFLSLEDLSAAFKALLRDGTSPEPRRRRVQGTFWLAMALDQIRATTVCLEDEVLPLALRSTGGEAMKEYWFAAMLHLRAEICPGWTPVNLNTTVRGRDRNDTLIAQDAAKRGVPVITRDADLVRKARARRGFTITPESFAAIVLPRDEARRRFWERYEPLVISWAYQVQPDGMQDVERTKRQCDLLRWLTIRMRYIWAEENAASVFAEELDRNEF